MLDGFVPHVDIALAHLSKPVHFDSPPVVGFFTLD